MKLLASGEYWAASERLCNTQMESMHTMYMGNFNKQSYYNIVKLNANDQLLFVCVRNLASLQTICTPIHADPAGQY